MGDPSKNLFLSEVLNVIRTENLLDVVTQSGKALLNGLYELQVLRYFFHQFLFCFVLFFHVTCKDTLKIIFMFSM